MASRVPNSSIPPYNAVGLLLMKWSNGKVYQGSGALIGSRYVLTCAHNLVDQKPRIGNATSVQFFPGWNSQAQPTGGIRASKWAYNQAYQDGQDAWDVGVVLLDQVAPGVNYFFQPQSVTSNSIVGMDLTLAGYPGDKNGEMWWDIDQVAGVELSTNTVLFTHDTYGGNSGSPLYVYDSVMDVIRQYAIHNSVNPIYGLRRGLLITKNVHDWIATAVKALSGAAAEERDPGEPERRVAVVHAPRPEEQT